MARVARSAGQRGRTIPARSRGGSPTRRDARYPASLHRRGHWGFGPVTGREWIEGSRGRVRRRAAIIAAGALLFLSGCQGDGSGGSTGSTAKAAPAAQISLTVAD